LQCGGIWIGGKGWGLTWKLIQCIVKPKQVVSVYGKCHIQLSKEELATISTQQISEEDAEVSEPVNTKTAPPIPAAVAPISTQVEDSDDEQEPIQLVPVAVPQELVTPPVPPPTPTPSPVEEPAAVVEAPAAVKKVVKKVVKK
jgi:hypothetical protein